MVPLVLLWLPILLSAVLVFIASFVIHMVLRYHRTDFGKVPNEDAVMDALRHVPRGEYVMPHSSSPADFKDPAFKEKVKRGPVVMMTVLPSGPPNLAKNLVQWFVYSVVVSAFAGYVASRALGPGAEYMAVFRFAGTTAFLGYGLGLVQNSIWFGRKWSTTLKSLVDNLAYGLLTAGVFGWLWPNA